MIDVPTINSPYNELQSESASDDDDDDDERRGRAGMQEDVLRSHTMLTAGVPGPEGAASEASESSHHWIEGVGRARS